MATDTPEAAFILGKIANDLTHRAGLAVVTQVGPKGHHEVAAAGFRIRVHPRGAEALPTYVIQLLLNDAGMPKEVLSLVLGVLSEQALTIEVWHEGNVLAAYLHEGGSPRTVLLC